MPPQHFTRVVLRNFKGHVHTDVPLSQFTLLVGANGAGKTSVLEAIQLVSQAHGALRDDRLDDDVIRRSIPENSVSMAGALDLDLKLEFGAGIGSLGLKVTAGPQPKTTHHVKDEEEAFDWYGKERTVPPEVVAAKGAILLRLETRAIVTPSQSQSEVPVIGSDGSGLATALKELKANDEARFDEFRGAVRSVIPLVEDFRFARRKRTATRSRSIRVEDQLIDVPESYDIIEDELLIRFSGTGFIRAVAASEGTLIAIALLGLLYASPQPPRVILIDDLDRGLHIEAQAELVRALRKVLERHPDTQIVATAHSPYLADHFEPSEVVILRRATPAAAIEARRLSEHPDPILREFKTGEALVSTGKDWFG